MDAMVQAASQPGVSWQFRLFSFCFGTLLLQRACNIATTIRNKRCNICNASRAGASPRCCDMVAPGCANAAYGLKWSSVGGGA
jgi:hypothetical protein